MRDRQRIARLAASPDMREILVRNAYRGVRVQFLLRGVVVAFMILVIAFVPPANDRVACYLLVSGYVLWTAALTLWTRQGGDGPVLWMWIAILIDALALGGLTLLAGASAEQSWTADILVDGLFLIPVIAATQLRPMVTAAVAGLATVVYLAASLATQHANGEPDASVLLRTFVIAGLGAGCVAMSKVQLSRVFDIAELARDRAGLLADLISVEGRERTRLAEQIHDGALQYVLAARMDVEDARDDGNPATFDRIDEALRQASALLRSTVTELHPAVLHASGLVKAVEELVGREHQQTGIDFRTHTARWPDGRSPVDDLLFGTVRELLANIRKHSGATSVELSLAQQDGTASLTVADDGKGMSLQTAAERLAEGHVGLASLRSRVMGAGGALSFGDREPSGTIVSVSVPMPVI
jgi:two-component system, NarL family, sensor kinase